MAGTGVLLLSDDLSSQVRGALLTGVLTFLPYGLVGSFLISRRPDLPFGWLLSGASAGLVLGLATAGPALAAVQDGDTGLLPRLGLLTSGLAFLPIGVQGLINVRFPSGKPATRKGRALEVLLVAGLCFVVLGGVLGSGTFREVAPDTGSPLANPLTGGTPVEAVADALAFTAPFVVLLGLVAGLGVVARFRRAVGIERQQLKWRATGVLAALALFPLAVTGRLGPVVDALDAWLFVGTIAVPVLRYRLWAIDTIIRRSVVYGAVTVVLVSGYALVAALGAALASKQVGVSVAAGAVALAFSPVRSRSQRLVDRLFYGQRSDPYQALSDVARRLDSVAVPGEVLPAVVAAVATSLNLPYVAVERPQDGSVLAQHGEASLVLGGALERWPLTYEGIPVGFLAASPRRGESAFDDRDRKVLGDIARQAAAAVRAEALRSDLLDSRQRLVTAREEERRRLRRDLHDGLGPMLTGLGLNLDAARGRLAADTPDIMRAAEFLTNAKEASSQMIADLRGMVYALRPPALDDLGLAGAVRVHAERLGAGAALRIDIDVPDLPELPAAVEVAVFRTAIEAINNVVRHGEALHCAVRVTDCGGQALVLEVSDDGSREEAWRPGVGLLAMRERAEELGGTLVAGPSPHGGHVIACYPLPTR